MSADIIIFAVIAAGLVFWLKSILGTRNGEEREKPNPFTAPITDVVQKDLKSIDAMQVQDMGGPALALPRNVTLAERAQDGMAALMTRDGSFDAGAFMMAVQDAFVIIVEAFAKGDHDTLKNLLTAPVYDSFFAAMTAREKTGDKISTEIHAVRKADITDIRFEKNQAFVTIRFIADETCVVTDKDNNIISGHPDRITEMNDVWTFTRDIKSSDPRWLVCETRDGDVVEEHKTPMPDAG